MISVRHYSESCALVRKEAEVSTKSMFTRYVGRDAPEDACFDKFASAWIRTARGTRQAVGVEENRLTIDDDATEKA